MKKYNSTYMHCISNAVLEIQPGKLRNSPHSPFCFTSKVCLKVLPSNTLIICFHISASHFPLKHIYLLFKLIFLKVTRSALHLSNKQSIYADFIEFENCQRGTLYWPNKLLPLHTAPFVNVEHSVCKRSFRSGRG